jgi:hypothetical protein
LLVFISYAHEDSDMVNQLRERLSAAGLEVFLDTKDISWGGRISSDVQRALERAAGVVVVVSPASVKSQWVPYEIGYATALRKPILPFLTHPSIDLPAYLADLRYITDLDAIGTFVGQVMTTGQTAVVSSYGEISDAARSAALLSEIAPQMEDLLSQMREDVQGDETGLIMEFVLLNSRKVLFTSNKPRFAYFATEIDNLQLKVDRLEGLGLVVDVATGNTPIYRMTPEFVAALRGTT